MIEKCSIGNMTNNIQNITLILLILILIIVIIYYLKNSNAKHNELIEKYTNTPIESSNASYITHYSANSQRNSNFPSTGTTVTLRDCQVQFNNTFTKDDKVTVDDNATVKYTYGDEWKEIDTLTEPGSSPIRIPEKIISRSNETNAADITNYSERTKCFRRMTASDNKYRYAGNNLIQYRAGSASEQGFHSELKVGDDGTPENYMEMKFNLAPSNSTNYYNNLTSSICSLQYTNNLGSDTGSGLGGVSLYRLTLDTNNKITAINQITINSTNNHIFTVSQTTSFADLLTSTSTISYVYSDGNFIFKNNSSLSSETNLIGVKIYKFNRELLCSHVQNNIKSYQIFDNKKIDANKIVNVSKASFSGVINGTKFPDAAISYASKNAVKTAIERRINTEIATANTQAISDEKDANDDITTWTAERDAFLTDINTKEKYLDKIFDTTLDASKKGFLVSTSGLITGLELDKLGYQTEDVSSSETILTSSQEPLFSNSQGGDIYTIETYTDTSKTNSITFNKTTVCEILIVGGGGGGGSRHGGGGGGGSVIHLTGQSFNATTYTIIVGSGGAGAKGMGQGNIGGDSSITLGSTTKYLAKGGGAGIHWSGTGYNNLSGGSGGGGGDYAGSAVNTNIPSGTYGTSGCTGTSGGNQYNWGGGGGGGASITDKCSNSSGSVAQAGNGGNGIQISISDYPKYYGGGGGGGAFNNENNKAGKGGLGGGGDGSLGYTNASHGLPNTGGGGGGGGFNGGHSSSGGNGGSGIVIIKYRNDPEQNENEKQMTLKYNLDNLIFTYRTDEPNYSWDEAYNEAINNERRMPTIKEMRDYMDSSPNVFSAFNGQDVWIPVLNYETTSGKDWVQAGNLWHSRKRSHTQDLGVYPSWGNDTSADFAKVYFEVKDSYQSITYNFNTYNDLTSWKNYATSIGATTLNIDYYSNNGTYGSGVWHGNGLGSLRLVLNNDNYNFVKVNFGNVHSEGTVELKINNVIKETCTAGQFKTYSQNYNIGDILNISELSSIIARNLTITLENRIANYKVTFPISTDVTINRNKAKFDAGTYDIIMGPSGSEIRNRASKILFGNYSYRDGNKLEFKYSITKTLQQLHDDSTSFSGTIYTIGMSDQKYSLGNKTSGTIKKYRVYIYKRLLNHNIQLYVNNTLLKDGTDYITGNDEDAVPKTINLRNLYITINKNIAGIIYLKSDKPIFFISEENRTSFNNTTDTQFGTNVNNLKASGSGTLSSLNDIFRVSEANTALTTAQNKKITYNINTILESPLTISYNSSTISTINPAGKNSLDNLMTTYNNIHRYNESSGGSLTEKINEYTFGNILNPTETDIEKYISYEYPTAPTADKLTPSSRNTAFDIRSNATKYVYFRKSS